MGYRERAVNVAHAKQLRCVGAKDDSLTAGVVLGNCPIGEGVDVDGLLSFELDQGNRLDDSGAVGKDVADASADDCAALAKLWRQKLAIHASGVVGGGLAVFVDLPAEVTVVNHRDHAGCAGCELSYGFVDANRCEERASRLDGQQNVFLVSPEFEKLWNRANHNFVESRLAGCFRFAKNMGAKVGGNLGDFVVVGYYNNVFTQRMFSCVDGVSDQWESTENANILARNPSGASARWNERPSRHF